jgi:hypothetical protein
MPTSNTTPVVSYKHTEWLPMDLFTDKLGQDCQVSVDGVLSAHIMRSPGEWRWEVFSSVEGDAADFLFECDTLEEAQDLFNSVITRTTGFYVDTYGNFHTTNNPLIL